MYTFIVVTRKRKKETENMELKGPWYSANGRRRDILTPYLINWPHTQNGPWVVYSKLRVF